MFQSTDEIRSMNIGTITILPKRYLISSEALQIGLEYSHSITVTMKKNLKAKVYL
jgi:hypothetical protein